MSGVVCKVIHQSTFQIRLWKIGGDQCTQSLLQMVFGVGENGDKDV